MKTTGKEYSVDIKKIGLVVLLITAIVIYFLLYNKWEAMTSMSNLSRALGYDNKEGFTSNPATINKATDSALGYEGLEDGSYTIDTLPEAMLLYINPILKEVLNQINKKTGARYYLRKIDRVNVVPISKGFIGCEGPSTALKSKCQSVDKAAQEIQLGVRYTVDFFAHELKNQDTHRFIVVFAINSNGEVQVEHFNISNGQIRPDKMFLNSGADMVDPLSSLIMTDTALGNQSSGNNSIMGVPTSQLEFSIFKPEGVTGASMPGWSNSGTLGETFLPGIFQSTAHPPNPNLNYPARKHGKWWDKFGVANVENATPQRKGLDHAVEVRPLQNYDNPTVARSESNSWQNENHWLFNRARGSLRQAQQI